MSKSKRIMRKKLKDIACDCSQLNICTDNKSVGVNGREASIEGAEICDDIDIYVEELEDFEEDNEVAE